MNFRETTLIQCKEFGVIIALLLLISRMISSTVRPFLSITYPPSAPFFVLDACW
jgi:hypothetical protein